MDFTFSEEQQMLADTRAASSPSDYGFERRNGVAPRPQGWSPRSVAQLAELGVLAVYIPEEDGGIGDGRSAPCWCATRWARA